ncbi:substrate-binding domain-containing protein [Lacticaseibacillus sp. GG6-2]
MKKALMGLGIGLLSISLLAACGKSSSSKTTSTKDMSIEVVAKGFQHDFWKSVLKGSKQAAKKYGVKMNFVGPKDETAVAEQLEMLNNAVNKNPNAIVLGALDTKAELDAIQNAKDKNIPIIGFDSGVPGAPKGAVKANASTDNYKAGGIAATHMYDALKPRLGKGQVRIGIVSQEVNSLSITQRTGGFIDKITKLLEADPNVGKGQVAVTGHEKFKNKVSTSTAKVIVELRVPAEVTDAAGKTEASALLQKKDLIGIYGSNEFGAKSIINADEGMGGKIGITDNKVIAVGFDSGQLQQDAIRSGKFLGSITQNPIKIGYDAVELAVKAAQGKKVKDVDTGVKWYDKANIEQKDIQDLLYE